MEQGDDQELADLNLSYLLYGKDRQQGIMQELAQLKEGEW